MKKMWNFRKNKGFYGFLSLSLTVLLASCGNGLFGTANEASGSGSSKAEKAYITVDTALTSRTVFPDQNEVPDVNLLQNLVLSGYRSEDKEVEEHTLFSAETLSELKKHPIPVAPGTWTFTLKADLNGVLFSGTTEEAVEIVRGTTTQISFNLLADEDKGGLRVKVSFPKDDNVTSVVATLTRTDAAAGAFTPVTESWTASYFTPEYEDGTGAGGTAGSTGGSTGSSGGSGTTSEVTGYSVTFARSVTKEAERLPGGYYKLVFEFYAEGTSVAINTIPYTVCIARGFTSHFEQTVLLNETYSIEYEDNGGVLDSDGVLNSGNSNIKPMKYSRKSETLPLPKMKKDGYGFAGWFEDADFTKPVSEIPAGSTGNKKFYAAYIKAVDGDVSIDSRAMNICLSEDSLQNLRGNSIYFSVKDAEGNVVTDPVEYYAELMYHGIKLDNYNGTPYYIFDEDDSDHITLTRRLPRLGNYQLYVTAKRRINSIYGAYVTSSQTFELPVVLGRQTALYNGSSYYLVDSVSDYTSDMTPDFRSLSECSSFDNDGKFYALKKTTKSSYNSTDETWDRTFTLKSNNSNISEDGIELTDLDSFERSTDYEGNDLAGYAGFTIDEAQNVFYAYGNKADARTGENEYGTSIGIVSFGDSLSVFKYPSLISDGNLDNSVSYTVTLTGYTPLRAVVYDGVLYCVAKSTSAEEYHILKFTLNDSVQEYTSPAATKQLTSGMSLSSYSKINDICCSDGVIYVLINEYYCDEVQQLSDEELVAYKGYKYYSRGVIIEYNTGTGAVRNAGLTNNVLSNTEIDGLYIGGSEGETLYKDNTASELAIASGSISLIGGGSFNKYFPSVYCPKSLSEKAFLGPQKIIAIKPKQLIVTDGGVFFYSDGALNFKNVNRIVTVDLEQFIIDSVGANRSDIKFVTSIGNDNYDDEPYYKKITYMGYLKIEDNVNAADIVGYYWSDYSSEYVQHGSIDGSMFMYMKKGD